jgi:DNA-directed RNA polymerase specialized sigma24 family protein
MNKVSITAEIKIFKKTGVWSSLLFNYFERLIEAAVSNYGPDLDREDAIQESWIFILKIIPKAKLKANYGAYFFTCLRHFMGELRERKQRGEMVSLEDIPEPIAKPLY